MMERMPSGHSERAITFSEDIDACVGRLNHIAMDTQKRENYQRVLVQGKKDVAKGKVPEWAFVEVLKEMRWLIDETAPGDDAFLDRLERHIFTLHGMRRVDDKAMSLEARRGRRTSRIVHEGEVDEEAKTNPPKAPPFTGGEAAA